MSGNETILSEQRDALVERLLAGDQRIKLGNRNGAETGKWETGWIRLLREYEQVCRQLETNGNEQREAA